MTPDDEDEIAARRITWLIIGVGAVIVIVGWLLMNALHGYLEAERCRGEGQPSCDSAPVQTAR